MDGNHQDLKIVVHTFSILFGCNNGVETIEADRKNMFETIGYRGEWTGKLPPFVALIHLQNRLSRML